MRITLPKFVGLASLIVCSAIVCGCSSGQVMSNDQNKQFNSRMPQKQKDIIAQHRRQSEFGLGNPQANAGSNQSSQ